MPAAKRQMHLGLFVLGTGNHTAGWRHEGGTTSNRSWPVMQANWPGRRTRLDESLTCHVVLSWEIRLHLPIARDYAKIYWTNLRWKKLVPQEGFEPPTPSLRMTCSTD